MVLSGAIGVAFLCYRLIGASLAVTLIIVSARAKG